jgi:hypothetical protein
VIGWVGIGLGGCSPRVDGDPADTGVAPEWPAPCDTYAAPLQLGTVVDPELDEISGVAVSRADPDVLWVEEDHSGDPDIYAIDPSGNTIATIRLKRATNNDWEDIAIAPCGDVDCLWIGEIGNNQSDRTGLGVYRIVEPDVSAVLGIVKVDWDFYGYVYPDENQNSEALVVPDDGLPVVLTKRYDDETSRIYQFPSLDAENEVTLTHLGDIASGEPGADGAAAVTAADIWPDGSRAIVRTYGEVFEIPLAGGVEDLVTAPHVAVTGADEPQGEAIAYDPSRRGFWEIGEGVNAAIWFTGCG